LLDEKVRELSHQEIDEVFKKKGEKNEKKNKIRSGW